MGFSTQSQPTLRAHSERIPKQRRAKKLVATTTDPVHAAMTSPAGAARTRSSTAAAGGGRRVAKRGGWAFWHALRRALSRRKAATTASATPDGSRAAVIGRLNQVVQAMQADVVREEARHHLWGRLGPRSPIPLARRLAYLRCVSLVGVGCVLHLARASGDVVAVWTFVVCRTGIEVTTQPPHDSDWSEERLFLCLDALERADKLWPKLKLLVLPGTDVASQTMHTVCGSGRCARCCGRPACLDWPECSALNNVRSVTCTCVRRGARSHWTKYNACLLEAEELVHVVLANVVGAWHGFVSLPAVCIVVAETLTSCLVWFRRTPLVPAGQLPSTASSTVLGTSL